MRWTVSTFYTSYSSCCNPPSLPVVLEWLAIYHTASQEAEIMVTIAIINTVCDKLNYVKPEYQQHSQ